MTPTKIKKDKPLLRRGVMKKYNVQMARRICIKYGKFKVSHDSWILHDKLRINVTRIMRE